MRHGATAIVLAGGRSTRFGSDKLAADIGGRSLLAATLAAIAPVVDAIVIAGPSLPAEAGSRIGDVPIALVRDREPFGGPLAALANVLQGAGSADVPLLVVGGDMPGLVPAVLQLMLQHLAATPGIDGVVLDRPPRRQPLPMVGRRGPVAAAAAAAFVAGDRSLVRLLDRLRVEALPAARWTAFDPVEATLRDVDRPEDLSRIRK